MSTRCWRTRPQSLFALVAVQTRVVVFGPESLGSVDSAYDIYAPRREIKQEQGRHLLVHPEAVLVRRGKKPRTLEKKHEGVGMQGSAQPQKKCWRDFCVGSIIYYAASPAIKKNSTRRSSERPGDGLEGHVRESESIPILKKIEKFSIIDLEERYESLFICSLKKSKDVGGSKFEDAS